MFLMELMKCVDELMMVGADGSGVRSKCVKVCELKEEREEVGGARFIWRRVQESRCRLIRCGRDFLIWCPLLDCACFFFFWLMRVQNWGLLQRKMGLACAGEKALGLGGDFACTLAQPNVINFYWLKNNNSRRKGHQVETSGSLAPSFDVCLNCSFNQA